MRRAFRGRNQQIFRMKNLRIILQILSLTIAVISAEAMAANAPYVPRDFNSAPAELDSNLIKNQNFEDFSASKAIVSQNSSIIESMPNFYSSSQASKFRVNVSNVCEKHQMRVTIRISKPFYGLIHAKERRKKPACFVEGNGEQTYSIDISYILLPNEPNFCGVVSHHLSSVTTPPPTQAMISQIQKATSNNEKQTTLSVVLVVRLHKSIEFSDDRYFLLSCANRCERPDCSIDLNSTSSRVPKKLEQVNQRITFAASESVVSPVLKSNLDLPIGSSTNSNQAKLSNKLLAENTNWFTEKCDLMLDMKFQWLLKLCWVLAFLLILMFCITFYLCLSFIRRKSPTLSDKNNHSRSSKTHGRISNSFGKHKKSNSNAAYAHSESLSCSNASGSHSTANTTATSATNFTDELMKIREDNTILAQQNQQLLLANLLAANHQHAASNGPPAAKGNFQNNYTNASRFTNNYDNHHENQPILGRLHDSNFAKQNTPQRINQVGEGQVKRRRSIGSSAASIMVYDGTGNGYNPKYSVANYSTRPLDSSQKAKSRSQTAIHYNQSQDPFKAIPFSYLNKGYLSDGPTSQQVYLTNNSDNNNNHLDLDNYNQFYPNSNHQNIDEALCQSLPVDNVQFQANNLTMQHSQIPRRWTNHPNKPSFVPPPAPTKNRQANNDINNNGRHVISQFDPGQNPHQLIDLIQQKHRQQIEQANRTAASLATVQPEQHQAMESRRAWR